MRGRGSGEAAIGGGSAAAATTCGSSGALGGAGARAGSGGVEGRDAASIPDGGAARTAGEQRGREGERGPGACVHRGFRNAAVRRGPNSRATQARDVRRCRSRVPRRTPRRRALSRWARRFAVLIPIAGCRSAVPEGLPERRRAALPHPRADARRGPRRRRGPSRARRDGGRSCPRRGLRAVARDAGRAGRGMARPRSDAPVRGMDLHPRARRARVPRNVTTCHFWAQNEVVTGAKSRESAGDAVAREMLERAPPATVTERRAHAH